MPKVSVIMPMYNSEKYIKDAVDSILNQTYKDFELLAVYDNGTTDNTPKILEEYASKDARVKPINIKDNRGIVKALNYGLKIANGKYIARMDADDISLPSRFEKQVAFLDNNKDVILCSTYVETFGEDDNRNIVLKREEYNHEFSVYGFFNGYTLCHPAVMFRKDSIVKIGGYNDEFKCCEDLELWSKCILQKYEIAIIDDVLLKYRITSSSKSANEAKELNAALECCIDFRISFVSTIKNSTSFKYIIWGSGNGGRVAKSILLKNGYNNFCGYIDKYQTGKSVFKPNELNSLDFDYIFIATTPGKLEAYDILSSYGYKYLENYVNLYN